MAEERDGLRFAGEHAVKDSLVGAVEEVSASLEGVQTVLMESSRAVNLSVIEERVGAIFRLLGHDSTQVCVLLVDDEEMSGLNAQWRGVDGPTDVLSFAMQEGEGPELEDDMLGDVVVSVETAERIVGESEHRVRVAEGLGVSVDTLRWELLDELTFLIIHGALHLLGHDHAESEEEVLMRAEEVRLMTPFLRQG